MKTEEVLSFEKTGFLKEVKQMNRQAVKEAMGPTTDPDYEFHKAVENNLRKHNIIQTPSKPGDDFENK